MLESVHKIIIHHTGRQYDHPFLITLRHKFLRWRDDIGYHYVIGNWFLWTIDGKIYQGRSEQTEGAHAFWYNAESLWICLIGNFDRYKPTSLQLESLYTLLEDKIHHYKVDIKNVLWHNELIMKNIKSCPGNNISMDKIRSHLYENLLLPER